MNDLISIIIPMYNTEKYIGKLLECLEKQTHKNLQIIVINDGSTDNSLKVVQDFAKKDTRIEIICTPNGGVSKARNIGLEKARGKYITFLDSDDYISCDMYEKMIEKMKENNVDVVRCNFSKEDINGNIIGCGNMLDISNKILNSEEIKTILIPYIFENKIETYTPLLLIKAEILKNISRFNPDIRMMEDLLFCLELFLNISSIYLYDYKCYYYLYHLSSSSKARNNIIRNFYDTLKVVSLVEKMLKSSNVNEEVLKEVYHVYSTMLVKYTLRTFQKEDEFKLSLEKLKELLDNDEVERIIKNVDFSIDSIYIKTAGDLIKDKSIDKLYNYAESIKEILI